MRLRATQMRPGGGLKPLAAIIRDLFASGEQGVWYDPSDLSTLFQDAAGTIPVTAVEQPVGMMLDKSGRGNHATQSTTTKRPVYSRRVNQLTATETCVGSDWSRSVGVTLDANAAPSPIGPSTATIVTTSGSGYHAVAYKNLVWVGAVTRSIELKKGNWRYVGITDRRQDGGGVVIDFDTGTVLGSSRFLNPTVVPLGDGWFRVGFSVSDYTSVFSNGIVVQFFTEQSSNPSAAVGLVGATVIIRAASFAFATGAHLPYQWVNTATDYDADPAKFPAYLRFDGVDDALQTGNIDFTSTDKMTVWAGVTKLSDATRAIIAETGGDALGSFAVQGPSSNGRGNYNAISTPSISGGVGVDSGFGSIPAPNTSVLCYAADISGDKSVLRVNAVIKASSTADQGTGNYGNHPLYIGARGGTSLYFNGRIYSLIIRGAAASDSQIKSAEKYINGKTRAF